MRLVVKLGGSLLTEPGLLHRIVAQLLGLRRRGHQVIVVHGGGKQIRHYLKELRIPTESHRGLRVTDPETMRVVLMVLGGLVNKNIVAVFNDMEGGAVGLCGADGSSFLAHKYRDGQEEEPPFDYGQVGEISQGNPALVDLLLEHNYCPIIACVGVGPDAAFYNVNADEMASAVALICRADRLIFLTDVPGVLDAARQVIPRLDRTEMERLRREGVISEGMLPKTRACERAIREGLSQVHIVGGREEDCLVRLLENGEPLGTSIH
ncbi:MAG: acetylglutamate kinase [Acidobacteria bacterium]|nr:acetylglutamate kinase [Acidobacteriota bacterium]